MLARALIGAVLSAFVALAARGTRTLATSGAIAGAAIGTISIAAGWSWGALLLSLFVSASALSGLGERKKAERVGSIVEKGDERDARQVLANIAGILADCGATLTDVAKTTVFVTDPAEFPCRHLRCGIRLRPAGPTHTEPRSRKSGFSYSRLPALPRSRTANSQRLG